MKLLVSMICLLPLLCAAQDLPHCTVPRLLEKPVIDGDLSDAVWDEAMVFTLDQILYKPEVRPSVETVVRMGYDEDAVYVAVHCADTNAAVIHAAHTGANNRRLGADDHIELYFRPHESSPYPYYQFRLGAGNATYEQAVTGPKGVHRNHDWSVNWPTATRITTTGWDAELAIPLYVFGQRAVPPKPMRFNMTRVKRTGKTEYIVWSPVGGKSSNFGFHDPERFGYLAGLESVPICAVCAPALLRARQRGNYQVTPQGEFCYEVEATVANGGGQAGKATLIVEDRPGTGNTTRHEFGVDVPAMGKSDLTLRIPVDCPADRTARLIIAEDLKRAVPIWMPVSGMESLVAMTGYPNLSYYSGEAEGRVTIGTAFPDEVFRARRLRLDCTVTNVSGETVAATAGFRKTSMQGVVVTLPVSTWAPGNYGLRAVLMDRDKAVLSKLDVPLRVVPPAPVGIPVTKIDHERMCVLLNGEPFQPYGFTSYILGGEDGYGRSFREWYRDARFNLIVDWWGRAGHTGLGGKWDEGADGHLARHLSRVSESIMGTRDFGVFHMPRLDGAITGSIAHQDVQRRDHKIVMDKLPTVIEAWKDNPLIIGWQGLDEPPPAIYPLLAERANLVRSIHPYRIFFASCYGGLNPDAYRAYDVYSVHQYWGPGAQYGPQWAASRCLGGYTTASSMRRPFWFIPQGQRFTYRRPLSPQERLVSIYLALINGAQGIIYFAPDDQRNTHMVTWRVMAYAGRLLEHLKPALLRERPPQNVTCCETATLDDVAPPELPAPRSRFTPPSALMGGPGAENMPAVQACFLESPGGPVMLLMANATADTLGAAFALAPAGEHTTVSGYLDGKTYARSGGVFRDSLEPYAVRLLTVKGMARKTGDPLGLSIGYTLPKEPLAEYRDMAKNGGFEQALDSDVWRTSGLCEVVTDPVFSGSRAVRLRGAPETRSELQQRMPLSPRTRYRVSFWAKMHIDKARVRPAAYFWTLDEAGKGLFKSGISRARRTAPRDGWDRYGLTFNTGDEPCIGWFFARVMEGTDGWMAIDDFKVEDLSPPARMFEVPDKRVAMKGYEQKENAFVYSSADDLAQIKAELPAQPGENLLLNSSFEQETLPDVPDCWMTPYFLQGYVGGQTDTKVDGQVSVRLSPLRDRPNLSYKVWTNWEPKRVFTLSFFARAAEPGAVLRVYAADAQDAFNVRAPLCRTVRPTQEWERYVWTFETPGKGADQGWRNAGTVLFWNVDPMSRACPDGDKPGNPGTIWLDAVQLELGEEATPYKPDGYRAPAIDPRWLSDDVIAEMERTLQER